MDEKKKITERKLTVVICLANAVFLCWSIIFPLKAEACGWFGENKYDDDDDSASIDNEVLLDHNENDTIFDPETQTKIGNLYRKGNGVAKDYVKAMHWYRKAANQGFVGGQNNLAVMYEQGLGVTKNISEAAKWYRKAAEQGNAYAQHSIGILYINGEGIPQDLEEAAKWIGKAAEQSHQGAFRDMGNIYWKGLGVSQNNIKAYMWWRLGVFHEDKESKRLLGIAAAKMKSSDIATAQNLALEWMHNHE